MTSPVSAIRNIGPDAAYARLLGSGMKPHFIGYYVLGMGLQGRPWNDCQGAEKQALRARFDALKAKHANPLTDQFERLMDQIGVRPAS
ncbi:MAG: competence protein TfoX [Sulfitobacter sp.]|nr:competence protein TfoX [Sulfitobacter sp.]